MPPGSSLFHFLCSILVVRFIGVLVVDFQAVEKCIYHSDNKVNILEINICLYISCFSYLVLMNSCNRFHFCSIIIKNSIWCLQHFFRCLTFCYMNHDFLIYYCNDIFLSSCSFLNHSVFFFFTF